MGTSLCEFPTLMPTSYSTSPLVYEVMTGILKRVNTRLWTTVYCVQSTLHDQVADPGHLVRECKVFRGRFLGVIS